MVLSKRERYVGIIVVAAVAILAIDRLFISPLVARKDQLNADTAQALQTQTAKQKLIKESKELSPRWNEINRSGLLKDASAAESQVYTAVNAWARDAGMNPPPALKAERTERVTKEGKDFIQVTIRATGGGNMEQITRFLYRMQTASIPVRINDITLTSRREGTDDLSLQMSIATIILAPEPEKPGAVASREGL